MFVPVTRIVILSQERPPDPVDDNISSERLLQDPKIDGILTITLGFTAVVGNGNTRFRFVVGVNAEAIIAIAGLTWILPARTLITSPATIFESSGKIITKVKLLVHMQLVE